jgi:hypothetical protein
MGEGKYLPNILAIACLGFLHIVKRWKLAVPFYFTFVIQHVNAPLAKILNCKTTL